MADNLPLSENLSTKNGNFICGVVEGFYGRPWTTEQRKDLFQKMKSWGMDSYVYAPKDDYKHRAYWRDLYTVEEAEHLTSLITSAHAHNITFYYALSPGLDITYSSAKELLALRRKLEQVSRFGCVAFALLFDDIESEMSEADKEVFQSFAHAQVTVSNEVYRYLGEPRFLVCPTQYCATRAVPTVTTSEYLNTLGSKLAPEIDIMWTGPKVISRQLTTDSIQEISDVLRRNPVIWDNLHANDYDQRRVFLGPYAGRSPHLHRKLRGVLTNPNCEYGANFVAIHTLAQWARCSVDGQREQNDSVSADIKLETETEDGLSGEDVPTGEMAPNMYHPRVALRNAIRDWLPEFERHKAAWGPIVKPQPAITVVPVPIIPSINTCMSLATTTTTTNTAANSILPATTTTTTTLVNTNQLQHLAEVCSTVCLPGAGIDTTTPQPSLAPLPVMNSLVSSTKVICNDSIPNPITPVPIPVQIPPEIVTTTVESVTSDNTGNQQMAPLGATTITILNGAILKPSAEKAGDGTITADEMGKCKRDESMNEVSLSPAILEEPMDCNNSTPGISPAHVITTKVGEDDIQMTDNSTSSCSGMNIENEIGSQMQFESSAEIRKNALTFEDLQLLCDLFYLPFEHGAQGLQILEEFNWLKTNAHHVIAANQIGDDTKPEVQEWFARAEKLNEMTQSVNKLLEHLTVSNNRELVYDLYAYVWDIRGVISLLNSYIKWLAGGQFPTSMPSFTQGTYTWFSKGWKETFMSGEQEPWVFRGGLTADLQRLIPVDSGNDLFVYKAPDMPTSIVYTIRPYRPGDETSVYSIVCRDRRISDNNDSVDKSPYRDLRGDMLVGAYLSLYPQFAMVVEDDDGIVGYACAVPDHKDFLTRRDVGWLPEMRLKYPLLPSADESQPSSQLQDFVTSLHTVDGELPPPPVTIGNSHPSSMTCGLLSVITDQSVSKRLVTCLLAALRANGSFGVHVIVDSTDTNSHGLYGKLGFTENQLESIEGKIIMVRTF